MSTKPMAAELAAELEDIDRSTAVLEQAMTAAIPLLRDQAAALRASAARFSEDMKDHPNAAEAARSPRCKR